MTERIELRIHHVGFIAAALAVCSCVTIPTPESIEREMADRSKTRSMEKLSTGSDTERAETARNLKYTKDLTAEEKVSALRKALKDPHGPVRANAAGSLNHIGEEPAARAAIPDLHAMLANPYSAAALNAVGALHRMDESPETLLPAARAVWQRPDIEPEDKVFAAALMGSLGAKAEEVAPTLVDGLRNNNDESRKRAYNRLRTMKPLPANSIPNFVQALESKENRTVKLAALLINQGFRPAPKEFLPAATAALARGDGDLNENLLTLLSSAKADAADSVSAITTLLHKQPLVTRNERVKGVSALGSIGVESDEVVDALLHVAQSDPDAQVRLVAMMTASRFTENTTQIRSFLESQAKGGATEEERNQAAGNLRMLDAMQQMKTQQ